MENINQNIEIDNLILLDEFNKEIFLNNIYNRFYISKKIYSFIGYSILISVNPYKDLENLYSEEKKNEYKKFFDDVKINPSIIPKPHLYYLVEDSYRNMLENQEDQNFIISGESGSGKTQTTKIIIDYLVNKTNENISEKLLASNPLLEAFGNAKTIRNNNSSRFGKFIKIFFSEQGKLLKANIESYLLEKSRVVNTQKGERNYHIFYQFILGSSKEEKIKYEIKNIEYYDYLNNKENNEVTDLNRNMNDEQDFKMTKENLKKFNFSEEDIDNIFKIISGILYLGNIKFKSLSNNNVQISDETIGEFEKAAKFLGLKEEELKKVLMTQLVYFGKETIIKYYPKDDCYINKDGMAQELYSKLFEFIIKKINKEMDNNNNNSNTLQISILDIFGFENFKNNSFEQLCINYCNERIQQFYNHHLFNLEQELYKQEGINWKNVEYKDNKNVILLIDGGEKEVKDCIFEGLKNQGSFKGNANKDIAFRNLLYKAFKANKEYKSILLEDKLDKDSIAINHYAGKIKYNVNGMVKKNLNQTSNDIKLALAKSTNSLISNLFTDVDPISRKSRISKYEKRLKTTLSEQFKKQLDDIFKIFNESNNRYIKCIKPNNKNEPNNFDQDYVLEQLNYGGIFETINVKNQGYPINQLKEDFYNKYKLLTSEKNNKQFNENIIKKIVEYFKKNDSENNPYKKSNNSFIEIGKTKIFMKNEFKLFLDFLLNKEKEKERKIQALLKHIAYKYKLLIKIRKFKSYIRNIRKSKSVKELIKIFSEIVKKNKKDFFEKIKIINERIIQIQSNLRNDNITNKKEDKFLEIKVPQNEKQKSLSPSPEEIKKPETKVLPPPEEPNEQQIERNSIDSNDENRNSLCRALYMNNELDINNENSSEKNTENSKISTEENEENKPVNKINDNNKKYYNINDITDYEKDKNEKSFPANNIVNENEKSKKKPLNQRAKNETLIEQIGMFRELFDEFKFWVENERNKTQNNNTEEINKLKKQLKMEKDNNKTLYNHIEYLKNKLKNLEDENKRLNNTIEEYMKRTINSSEYY